MAKSENIISTEFDKHETNGSTTKNVKPPKVENNHADKIVTNDKK